MCSPDLGSTTYWALLGPNRIPVSTSIGCPSFMYCLNLHWPKAPVMALVVLVDDDSDQNRIVLMLGKNRADPRDYVLVIRI